MREKKSIDIINEKIRDKEILLIDENGEKKGVVNTKSALGRAYDLELDLVLIAAKSKPPVARIMDYGKYKYEKQKKDKENKQKQRQKAINIKIIRISPNIDIGDYNTKVKQATKFLKNGDRVQFVIRFKGRMIAHTQLGRNVLNKLVGDLSEYSTVEQKPKMEGRRMHMLLGSNIKK